MFRSWISWLAGFHRRVAAPAKRQPRRQLAYCEDLELRRLLTGTVSVTPITSLVTTEAGGAAEFNVVLSQQPEKPVRIPVKSSNTAEGALNISQLVFTKDNWNQAQKVTVKGVDDDVTDGNRSYSILLGVAKGDKLYRKVNPADVSLVNQDNEQLGIQITGATGLQTSERATSDTFSIRLLSKPTTNVTIPFHSTNPLEGTVTASVTFTPTNWNQAKTVTITGVNDFVVDGDQSYQIVAGPAVSADARYSGLSVAPLDVINTDNDFAGLQISSSSALSIFEGFTKDVTVKLRAQPKAAVTVNLTATTGGDQASLFATSLTFTPANWNVSQTITFRAKPADGVDGDQEYALSLTTTSSDAAFHNLPARTIGATIIDTDNQPFAGNFVGTYSGSVTVSGFSFFPQNGDVAFSLSNNLITVTEPDDASGTITGFSGVFAPTTGPLVGAVYTGTFIQNADGSVSVNGTWTYSHEGDTGEGVWSAFRPAPTVV